MKYAHIEKTTNKLLGWYDKDIHEEIPTHNVEVTDEVWQEALNTNANCYENGKFIHKDFRTTEQIKEETLISFRANRDALLKEVDIYQGVLIYSELTDIQKNELKQYRLDLLESTETLVLPSKPSFIKETNA